MMNKQTNYSLFIISFLYYSEQGLSKVCGSVVGL